MAASATLLPGERICFDNTTGIAVEVIYAYDEGGNVATPEGLVKTRVKHMLNAFAPDVYFTMPLTGGFGGSGTPDFLACCWGHFLAVECKAGDNTTTALQDREIARIRAASGEALVINERNLDSLAVLLAAWKGRHGKPD